MPTHPSIRSVAMLTAIFLSVASAAEVLHSERSLYQTILVVEQAGQRCMQFTMRREVRNQTCIDLAQPKQMVFSYTKMMLAGLLVTPDPKRMLMIGLGGGTLPTALAELFPDASIDVVEIDPAVVTVAKKYFAYAPSTHTRIHVQDARVFGKRAALAGDRYDAIFFDAYNGDYIPEHLMTREYLEETRQLLAENGVVSANTFAISRLYHHESVTYEAVFGRFFNLRLPETANRIITASVAPLPAAAVMQQRAAALQRVLEPYGVPIETYARSMTIERDWNTAARPLTDQYSPANLLREID